MEITYNHHVLVLHAYMCTVFYQHIKLLVHLDP